MIKRRKKKIIRMIVLKNWRTSFSNSHQISYKTTILYITELINLFNFVSVSLVDLSFIAQRDTSVEEINQLIAEAACDKTLSKVLGVNKLPLVSIDFNHNPLSSIFDATQTRVSGRLVKVMSWYDNEWGFSNRMLDNAIALMHAQKKTNKDQAQILESVV